MGSANSRVLSDDACKQQQSLQEDAPEVPVTAAQEPSYLERSQSLRLKQTEGSFARVLGKMALAGTAGMLGGPLLFRPTGKSVLVTGALTAVNCALVVGFFDLARESLTALMLVDTPMTSLIAGALTGYVWNGIAHQSRPRAIAGALVVGSAATMAHTLLPHFHYSKAITGILLEADLIDDPEGHIRSAATAPPVLPPLSWYNSFAWLESFVLSYMPVRKVSDAEFEEMERHNSPVRLSFRKDPKHEG